MHSAEIKNGKRFEFGKNWQAFLRVLNDERINIAQNSLKEMLEVESLQGKTFVDAGCGSGLFSLAARKLGAKVYSFDYDPASVACTNELRARYYPDNPDWEIRRGSVLDQEFIDSLGQFDVVYSWGVLHHTGDMRKAIANTTNLVKNKGAIFIAIYNDQGKKSLFWKRVKEIYCSNAMGKAIVRSIFMPYFFYKTTMLSFSKKENIFSLYKKNRGMSIKHDWYDWLGGLPFEVARVEKIFHSFKKEGFKLDNIKTTNSLGCNQYVFTKTKVDKIFNSK